jgi:demethylspheroidene O-methyltransferase
VTRPRASLADRWLRLRDRVLADARFQRWAARFPLARLVARRQASTLFDLCAGFVYAQVLHAAVRLRLLDALAEGPQTAAELAPKLALRPEASALLLDAAAALKLVERRGPSRYGLGIRGAAILGNPAVARMIEHHALLYRDLADPVALLRGDAARTELGRFWSYVGAGDPGDAQVAGYSALMASSQALLADDILDAYPFGRHRRLLDVGGGEGAFVEAAAARAPGLGLALFDLPPVAARARERLGRAGLLDRVTVVGGDLFREPLPEGADLATLVRVLHDHDDAQALRILQSVRRALTPEGALIIAEPMAGGAAAEPIGDAYFGFYLLAMGQGRPRTPAGLRALLLQAGFGRVRERRTHRPMLVRLLVADRR